MSPQARKAHGRGGLLVIQLSGTIGTRKREELGEAARSRALYHRDFNRE
jgi:hypothetical protein